MHSIVEWNLSRRPNYTTNVDKKYHYSEVPYIGQYHLVKLPLKEDEILDHVDYWGEGRINTKEGVSGFTDCYNVNHHYQQVSNGPDRNYKIPNRVPVISYTNCDTSSYIRDNSVKLVTVMGSPINKSCAADIARMVNKEVGRVVVFGFEEKSPYLKNLIEELNKKDIQISSGFKLPKLLEGLTLYDNKYKAYLNTRELSEELYESIREGSYENAVTVSKNLESIKQNKLITDVFMKLLKDTNNNAMTYAYKLWTSGKNDLVSNALPQAFSIILNGDNVKIVNKKHTMFLRLDDNVDANNERQGQGNTNDVGKNTWKFVPFYENNQLYFKIKNSAIDTTAKGQDIFLKLDELKDEKELAKGAEAADGIMSQWILEPSKVKEDLLFYITNRQFHRGLKLSDTENKDGDRVLVSSNVSISDQPEAFGWFIRPNEIIVEYTTKATTSTVDTGEVKEI